MAEDVGRGLERAGAPADRCPAADGGDGTAAVLVPAMDGELRSAPAHDPLGRPIEAEYGLVRDGSTAIVEVAAASGLDLVGEAERDPERASSAGTGELIVASIEAGASRVLVAAGGSATTDGGRGAIDALEKTGLRGAKLEVLCDTSVPFELAAETFAPQKGASPEQVERLTSRLVAEAGALPRDPRGRPMTGAAGGLSGGLWAALGAHLVPGATFVLGVLGFDRRLEEADAVITGEGRLDEQSLAGKLPGEIARRCRAAGVPLHAIVGQMALPPDGIRRLG
ncbi:MAG TPA: glycerate kinase, partial [Solirubrobacterales bacterium]|nr:glycerate kinase [Solirubrobacterales bacterium]